MCKKHTEPKGDLLEHVCFTLIVPPDQMKGFKVSRDERFCEWERSSIKLVTSDGEWSRSSALN